MSVELEQVQTVDEVMVHDVHALEQGDVEAMDQQTNVVDEVASAETVEVAQDVEDEQTYLPVDPVYVRELERRLARTEADLERYKSLALAPAATFIARVKGAALKPDKDGRLVGELKLEIPPHECDLSKWAAVAEITASGEGAIRVALSELLAQKRLEFDGEEPQAIAPNGDAPAKVDADEADEAPETPIDDVSSAGEDDPPAATDLEAAGEVAHDGMDYTQATDAPPPATPTDESAAFVSLPPGDRPDVIESGLPVFAIEGSLNMGQLAELAYQAGLSECVIELTRVVQRGDQEIQQTHLYHYRGPGGEPVIERLTTARLPSWIREMQARRTA